MALTEKLTAIADAIRSRSGKGEKLTLEQMPGEIIGLQSLNFEVVGNPQPENPKANTIWVDTDAEITGWDFSAAEPVNPAEGMVWFSTGTASSVAFNALKENSVMVYPLSAKQYSGGELVDKTAKSYQNSAWVEWLNELVLVDTNGVREGYSKSGSASTTVTVNINNITVKYSGGGGSTASFSWADIDVTEYSVMEFTISGSGSSIKFYVGSAASTTVKTSGTYELDISQVSGNQEIGFSSVEASFTVTDWRLKH